MSDRIVSCVNGRFGRITLHAEPLNILGAEDIWALTRVLRDLDRCAVILLDAHGTRAFSAGIDVADHVPDRAKAMLDAFSEMAQAFLEASPVIVCAVNGPALGGGFELVLLADLVICSTRAYFALPEIQLAALPPIACAVLPRLVGRQRAFDAIVTGKQVDAETALAIGLVSDVVEPEALAQRALGLCERLLSYSGDALVQCKRAINAGSIDAALRIYRDDLLPTSDAAEGINAFLEKRAPVWVHARHASEVTA